MTITRGGYSLNRPTNRYVQIVTVKNNSATSIAGPVSLVLDALSGNATLFNKTGTTTGAAPLSPYINLSIGADNQLTPNESVTVILQFTNPLRRGITYNTRSAGRRREPMKGTTTMKLGKQTGSFLLMLGVLCLSAAEGRADVITFDTSSLVGGGVFSLDFQLADGAGDILGDANNTVTLSGFNFGVGGDVVGAPTLDGGASGNISTTVSLTDSAFFNFLCSVVCSWRPVPRSIWCLQRIRTPASLLTSSPFLSSAVMG
ncbi:MAG: hypothetical protein WKF84_02055 [Pyrinomonadaceae bacterium]